MFKCTTANDKLLELVSRTTDMMDEGIIAATKEGLSFKGTDRSMVCFMGWNLKAAAFDTYEIDADTEISLNFTDFIRFLKRIGAKSKATLEVVENKLRLTAINGSTRIFTMPMIDIKCEHPDISALKYETTAEIKTVDLQTSVDDVETVGGDSIVMSSTQGLNRFLMKGGNADEILGETAELNAESKTMLATAKARYPLDFLGKIAKTKIGRTVSISYGTDVPAKFEFKDDNMSLMYVLAPRIGGDEEKPKEKKPRKAKVEAKAEAVEEKEETEDEEDGEE